MLGNYDVTTWDEVEVSRRVHRKKLVIGLYPGIGSRWYGGKTQDWAVEAFAWAPLGMPALNVMMLGIPTFVSWFHGFSLDWEPLSDHRRRRGEFAAVSAPSLEEETYYPVPKEEFALLHERAVSFAKGQSGERRP